MNLFIHIRFCLCERELVHSYINLCELFGVFSSWTCSWTCSCTLIKKLTYKVIWNLFAYELIHITSHIITISIVHHIENCGYQKTCSDIPKFLQQLTFSQDLQCGHGETSSKTTKRGGRCTDPSEVREKRSKQARRIYPWSPTGCCQASFLACSGPSHSNTPWKTKGIHKTN